MFFKLNQVKNLYQFILNYLREHLTRIQLLMLLSVGSGILSGLSAVFLKILVHKLQYYTEHAPFPFLGYLLFPMLGIGVSAWLLQKVFKGKPERGLPMVLKKIAGNSSIIPLKHTWIHAISASFTTGFGGSVGLEAPIVSTGAALGSNLSRLSELSYQERTLLIACGASAGISAAFNAPITGVIFAVEIILSETIASYFIPLIISSVTGALLSKIILDEQVLFNFALRERFNYHNVPLYIVLGILAGFISLYYAKACTFSERSLQNAKWPYFYKVIFGGLLLINVYMLLPPLYGEGFDSIKDLAGDAQLRFSDHTGLFGLIPPSVSLLVFIFLAMLAKPLAAGVTIGSGGNGGNFAPSLFTGAFMGYGFAKLLNLFPSFRIPVSNFTLVGMAGVLSGVMYAPLSAIFLIAEITGGYELFIPLMIVSSLSFFIVKSYQPYSMDMRRLAAQGQIFTENKEFNILSSIQMEQVIDNGENYIYADDILRKLAHKMTRENYIVYAVVDRHKRFMGVIELTDLQKKITEPGYDATQSVTTLMKKPTDLIKMNENMRLVMQRFDRDASWYLPVVDDSKKFCGFISKSLLFDQFRKYLGTHEDLYEKN